MGLAVSLKGDLVPVPPPPVDWANVMQFGAKGDGTTNDTAAIQAAINTGKTVYFPRPSVGYKAEGLYPVVTGQQFICENSRHGNISPVTTGGHVWDLTINVPIDPFSGQGAFNYIFDGFCIVGTNNGSTGSSGDAWHMATTNSPLGDNCCFRNCVVRNMGTGWNINGIGNTSFIQCSAQECNWGMIIGNTSANSFSMVGIQCAQNYLGNYWIKSGFGSTIILGDGNYGGATSVYDSAIGIKIGDDDNTTGASVTLMGANFEEQVHSSGIALQVGGYSRVTQINALYRGNQTALEPVTVNPGGYYHMVNVTGGANNIPCRANKGSFVTGDGSLFNYGYDDGAGPVLCASSEYIVRMDNEVPLIGPEGVNQKYAVVYRNGQNGTSYTAIGVRTGVSGVTISVATPAVVGWTAHGLSAGQAISFTNVGTFPTGISTFTTYYVSSDSLATDSFRIAANRADALAGTNSLATTGSVSGVITGYYYTVATLPNTASANTWTGNNTFTAALTNTSTGTFHATNGILGTPASSGATFGNEASGAGYAFAIVVSNSVVNGFTVGGVINSTLTTPLYLPNMGGSATGTGNIWADPAGSLYVMKQR